MARADNKTKYKDEWYLEPRYECKDYASMVRLHADLKAALNEILKTNNSFVYIIDKAIFYTDLYKSKSNKNMKIISSVKPLRTGTCGSFIETYRWLHYLFIKPIFFNVLSKVAMVFSFMIVIGEFFILF